MLPVRGLTQSRLLPMFECRNKLRGNANMTTKRDMLLTLVFLRFICSRFNEQKEKISIDIEMQGRDISVEIDFSDIQKLS